MPVFNHVLIKEHKKNVFLYDNDNVYELPSTINKFIIFLNDLIKDVPEEFQEKVEIEFTPFESYGELEVRLTIFYERPMNKEELDTLKEQEQNKADEMEDDELKELSRLQAKYIK